MNKYYEFPTKIIREGLVRVIVPDLDAYRRPDGVYEPAWAPVFYNPRMSFNRDIAILFARVSRRILGVNKLSVAEPLAGTGVRGIRYAVEAGAEEVYMGDISRLAVEIARQNIQLNRVDDRVRVEKSHANKLLYKLVEEGVAPSIIDIDPFGSPIPFVDTTLEVASRFNSVVALTATDTAPLTGTHSTALRRRYWVLPGRTGWEREQAVRILLGSIIRRAASIDYGVKVFLAYYTDYYVRVYIGLIRGASRADESLNRLVYGVYCPSCSYSSYSSIVPSRCPICHHRLVVVGPLYSGEICAPEIVEEMIRDIEEVSWIDAKKAEKLLTVLKNECSLVNPYYRVDKISAFLRVEVPRVVEVVKALEELGYRAARTHFDPRGFKTDAPYYEILNTFLSIRRPLLS